MKYAGAFVCLLALVSFAAAQQLDTMELDLDPVPRILQEVMGSMGDAAPTGAYGAAAPTVAAVGKPAPAAPVEPPTKAPAEAPVTVAPAPAPVTAAPAPVVEETVVVQQETIITAPVEAPVQAPAETPAAPEPTPIPETPVVAAPPVQAVATPKPAPVAETKEEQTSTCPTGTTMVSYIAGTLYCVLPEAGALEGEVYIAMPGKVAVSSGNKCFASACSADAAPAPATTTTTTTTTYTYTKPSAGKVGRKMLGSQETQGTNGAQFLPFLMAMATGKDAPAPATTTTTTTTTYTTSAPTPAPAHKKLAHSKCFYVCEATKAEAVTVMKSNP